MGTALLYGTLVGIGWGLIELAAGGQASEALAVVAVYTFLGTTCGAAAWIVSARVRDRAQRAALSGTLTLAAPIALAAFVWAHFGVLRAAPWLSAAQLAGAAGSVAGGLLVGWLAARHVGPLRRRLLHPEGGRGAACASLAIAAAAALVAVPTVARLPAPVLGSAGRACELPWNVLFITIDTLRSDHLSSYGYERPTGQALEPYAFCRIDGAVAVSCWTRPTTATLLTGTYPSTHQVVGRRSILSSESRTLTEILREAGMATAFLSGNINASGVFDMDQGAHFTLGNPYRPDHPLAGTTLGVLLQRMVPPYRDAVNLNERALEFLAHAKDRRFLLYVHYDDPHTPYDPPPHLLERYHPRHVGPDLVRPRRDPAMSAEERERLVARYDAEIHDVVDHVALLLEAFEREGLLDDTLVLLTADHGESLGEHGKWTHSNSAYQELLAIPLLVRPPKGLPSVASVTGGCSQVDVLPTILDYLGLAPPAGLPGRSLRAWVEGGAPEPERLLLTECYRLGTWSYRRGRYKVILTEGLPQVALYDLIDDPHERADLSGREDLQPVLARLVEDGNELRKELVASVLEGADREIDPEMVEILRELGYVE